MTLPRSRAVVLVAVLVFVAFGVVASRPTHLTVVRERSVGGRLDLAQEILFDVTRAPSWAPWVAGEPGSAQVASAPDKVGSSYTWSNGELRLDEAKALSARFGYELRGSRSLRFELTMALDDPGSGLLARASYRSAPRGIGQKLVGMFRRDESAIARQLDDALGRFADAVAELEQVKATEARERAERAAKAAQVALEAARLQREQAEFEAALDAERLASGQESAPPRKPRPRERHDHATEPHQH